MTLNSELERYPNKLQYPKEKKKIKKAKHSICSPLPLGYLEILHKTFHLSNASELTPETQDRRPTAYSQCGVFVHGSKEEVEFWAFLASLFLAMATFLKLFRP